MYDIYCMFEHLYNETLESEKKNRKQQEWIYVADAHAAICLI